MAWLARGGRSLGDVEMDQHRDTTYVKGVE